MSRRYLPTNRKESAVTRFYRFMFNIFPCYRGSGGRVVFISSNWHEIQVRLKLSWRTRNYVGSVFGGSIYGSIDPIYMFQLLKILGKEYIVWDKAATIKFIRPIKTTVYAKFEINNELINEIKLEVSKHGKYIVDLPVEYIDKDKLVYAISSKHLYIASKDYYKARNKMRANES